MITVKSARYLSGYKLWVEFNTNEAGEVDLSDMVERYPAAASLRDTVAFSAFFLDAWPTVVWPCGFDVSPETLYERATGCVPVYMQRALDKVA